MSYRLAPSRYDDGDPAGGFVLRSAPGHPAYPVVALPAQTRKITPGTAKPALQRFRVGARAALLGRVGGLQDAG
ncbi:MAG TPA: hypothetical protein VK453_26200 [Micromonosporaceae bacterium]|nr:hypothetical protein [Micromonosporaceae bacterium]